VSRLESIVADLRSLPPGKLELAADYIERLKRISDEERQAVLARTFGSLSREDADAMEKAIEEGCERIDERDWWCPAGHQRRSRSRLSLPKRALPSRTMTSGSRLWLANTDSRLPPGTSTSPWSPG
jgi:hypothetical protein